MASQKRKKNQKKTAVNRTRANASSANTAKSETAEQESVLSHFKKEIWGVACGLLALLVILSSLDKTSFLARLFMGLVGDGGL